MFYPNRFASLCLVITFIFITSLAHGENVQWNPDLTHGQLDNGFNYVFYNSDNNKDPFNLRLIVNAGSVDDEQRGMAHVVEHMVFRANRAHDVDMHRFLDQIGWKTGIQVNALTRQTETQYMVRTRPDDALDITQSVKFLSDLAFGAKMKADEWQVEREVVLEEMRRSAGVTERVNTAKKQVIRNGSRYVDRPTIGTKNAIMQMDIEHIRDFYHTYYVPGNMTLVASGHFNAEHLVDAIETHFGAEESKAVPNRDYVKLPLKEGLVVGKVQDPMGTTSAVVYGFRNQLEPSVTETGAYQRLQNYFLRKLITPYVRAAKGEYENQVSSVHIKFSEPTNERLVVAMAVKTADHPKGLEIVLNEIERLKQHGVQETDLQGLKVKTRAAVARNKILIPKRDFAKWEDKLTQAVMQESVEEDYAVKSARTLKWIDEMTVDSLNTRLRELLTAPDQFVFYQVPGGLERGLPTKQDVESLQARIQTKTFERIAPAAPMQIGSAPSGVKPEVKLPDVVTAKARVLSKHKHLGQNVVQWKLANGDDVVWLNQKTPDNRLYIKLLSDAGYFNKQQQPWLAQAALQVWQQSDYANISNKDLQAWQQDNHAEWSWSQKEIELDLSSIVSKDKLEQLMQAYLIMQTDWKVEDSEFEALRHSLNESVAVADQDEIQRAQLWGSPSGLTPLKQQLTSLSRTQFTDAITQLKEQPVSMYIVGESDDVTIERSVLPYLNGIKRTQDMETFKQQLPDGNKTVSQPRYRENKATVLIKSESQMDWTPEQSFLVSSLNPIVQKALKNKLRHELGGIYSLRYEMTLDKDNHVRMETEFTTAPEKVDELITAYERVLMELSVPLGEENYPRVREDIRFAEQLRLSNPNTWLRRLALSYERYQAPDYLQSMQTLDRQVNQEQLSEIVKKIIPFSKQAILIGTPKPSQDI
ncbi:MAG: insulinase family protein [Vibrionaceae bacterium]|nr:insulinase family protein [Vibrionaceae bacterium]